MLNIIYGELNLRFIKLTLRIIQSLLFFLNQSTLDEEIYGKTAIIIKNKKTAQFWQLCGSFKIISK